MAHRTIKYLLILPFALMLAASGCYYDAENELYGTNSCDSTTGTYSTEVKPLMDNFCVSCHSTAVKNGGIALDSHAEVSANATKVLATLDHQAGVSQMPKGSPKLDECEIKKVRIWIEKGKQNN
jgi:mono/diheme cytochrome c family protein